MTNGMPSKMEATAKIVKSDISDWEVRIEASVCRVVNTGDDVTVAFRVGGPEHDHTIQTVLFLEPLDIGPNVIEMNVFVHPGD